MHDSQLSVLGTDIETAEIQDGAVSTAKIADDACTAVKVGSASGEGQILVVPIKVTAVAGTWIFTQNSGRLFSGYLSNSSSANNDECSMKVYLAKGTYKLIISREQEVNQGIVDFYLDAVEIGSVDFYGASAPNQVDTITGITVSATGLYDFKIKVDGKNGSSSNYKCYLYAVQFERTA